MKPPRISVGAIMASLVVVAIDCVIYRSVASRPESLDQGLSLILQATLPMANVLALVLGSLVRGRAESRPGRIGFAIGAGAAIVATIVGFLPALYWFISVPAVAGLERRLTATPILEMVTAYGIVVGLPLLGQFLVGLVGSRIGRRVGARRVRESIVGLPSRRFRFATLAALVVIVAVPAVAVEGHLRRKVDPMLTRLEVGSEAVIDLANPAAGPIPVPKTAKVRQLDGTRVRVESDREPFLFEQFETTPGRDNFIHDCRTIRVTILDGPRAGEAIGMTHHLLRPIR